MCHLQAVVEILEKYNQLDNVVYEIQTTTKVPKMGSPLKAVPIRLELSEDEVNKIKKSGEAIIDKINNEITTNQISTVPTFRVVQGRQNIYADIAQMIEETTDTIYIATTLDDVFIAGFEQSIDGRGGVLGFAGPDFVYDDTGLTMTGSMFFDSTDIERLLRSDPNFWTNIVEHEMGHVLGIGTLVSLSKEGGDTEGGRRDLLNP